MAIKYNVVAKAQPGVAGGGIQKWYATMKNDGEFTVDDLVLAIEKFSSLSEADIRGVLLAVENVITKELANGKIIRLDKLGSFYPSLSSDGAPSEQEFHAKYIKGAKIHYKPGPRIAKMLQTIKFIKA